MRYANIFMAIIVSSTVLLRLKFAFYLALVLSYFEKIKVSKVSGVWVRWNQQINPDNETLRQKFLKFLQILLERFYLLYFYYLKNFINIFIVFFPIKKVSIHLKSNEKRNKNCINIKSKEVTNISLLYYNISIVIEKYKSIYNNVVLWKKKYIRKIVCYSIIYTSTFLNIKL